MKAKKKRGLAEVTINTRSGMLEQIVKKDVNSARFQGIRSIIGLGNGFLTKIA